jgi:hypothetical protein
MASSKEEEETSATEDRLRTSPSVFGIGASLLRQVPSSPHEDSAKKLISEFLLSEVQYLDLMDSFYRRGPQRMMETVALNSEVCLLMLHIDSIVQSEQIRYCCNQHQSRFDPCFPQKLLHQAR